MTTTKIKGISACPGVVSGKVFIFAQPEIKINNKNIVESQIEQENQLFDTGRTQAKEQLENIKRITLKNIGVAEAEIFDGHIEILLDESMEEEVKTLIKDELFSADKATQIVADQYIEMFSSMEDTYMRERAADMKDIFRRLVSNILGIHIPQLSEIDEPSIVIAFDLTPSDTAQMDKEKVLGFVTAEGGATSHVAIMSRTLVIPAIVGAREILDNVQNGQDIILDGSEGDIIINPNVEDKKFYDNKLNEYKKEVQRLAGLKNLPAITKDGVTIDLCANVGTDIDALPALEQGAKGVGLYRSEFLYMDRSNWPSEEEQTNAYANVVRAFDKDLVIIRTLDIGGDKSLDYFTFPHELNPFLGWRALRVCLDKVDIFKTQLRSILQASAHGKVGIMYPMVISLEEVQRANELLEECKKELLAEGIDFDPKIQRGVMIETPSAAMIANELADLVDFFSYGTNDLTQYTLAVDRGNPHIVKLYDSFHPSVLRLMAQATAAANAKNVWVGVCGELGGHPLATLFLIGIGVKELSMSAISIPKIKEIIRATTMTEAKEIAQKVLSLGTGAEIQKFLEESLEKVLNK
ncbi:MAG: phosphoenolpyruvate--protein phosphotransferase [Spirochaetota bacterium]|nr:phosphoenolpyruvate--protein phosphotransferase [Spirochaetota bacterium]